METLKQKLDWDHTWHLWLIILLLIVFVSWQQSLIADLQERMMNIEASRYDDQIATVEWIGTLAREENKEQQKDILSLQKQVNDYRFRVTELEWDLYGKTKDPEKKQTENP